VCFEDPPQPGDDDAAAEALGSVVGDREAILGRVADRRALAGRVLSEVLEQTDRLELVQIVA
jgi:hypothetical protein